MSFQDIAAKNPNRKIYKITDEKFQEYGKVYTYDVKDVCQYVDQNVELPETGTMYERSLKEVEKFPIIKIIEDEVYGHMKIQAGVCGGYNHVLDGLEYHQGSEVTFAVTDCLLVLGKRQDMVGDTYNGDLAEVFYAEAGQVFELYDRTLHYAPCQVGEYFKTVVLLLDGTNEMFEKPEGLLTGVNKWFIAHESDQIQIEKGCYPGLLGEMIEIKNG